MKKLSVFGLCALAATFSFSLFASTPDGQTPAEETVCDNEEGVLFGLCNAYCEAMDCELAYDEDPNTEPHASDNACEQVLSNYQKHSDGQDPPCLGPLIEE